MILDHRGSHSDVLDSLESELRNTAQFIKILEVDIGSLRDSELKSKRLREIEQLRVEESRLRRLERAYENPERFFSDQISLANDQAQAALKKSGAHLVDGFPGEAGASNLRLHLGDQFPRFYLACRLKDELYVFLVACDPKYESRIQVTVEDPSSEFRVNYLRDLHAVLTGKPPRKNAFAELDQFFSGEMSDEKMREALGILDECSDEELFDFSSIPKVSPENTTRVRELRELSRKNMRAMLRWAYEDLRKSGDKEKQAALLSEIVTTTAQAVQIGLELTPPASPGDIEEDE